MSRRKGVKSGPSLTSRTPDHRADTCRSALRPTARPARYRSTLAIPCTTAVSTESAARSAAGNPGHRQEGHDSLVIEPLRDEVQNLSPHEQRRLAGEIAAVVAPYGLLAPEVVSPDAFRSMLEQLLDGLGQNDLRAVGGVRHQCRTIIDRYDEEPADKGFFALGAVVALYYATEAVLGDASSGAMQAVMRLLDLVGASDDDGASTGLHDKAYGWIRQGRSDANRERLAARVKASADALART